MGEQNQIGNTRHDKLVEAWDDFGHGDVPRLMPPNADARPKRGNHDRPGETFSGDDKHRLRRPRRLTLAEEEALQHGLGTVYAPAPERLEHCVVCRAPLGERGPCEFPEQPFGGCECGGCSAMVRKVGGQPRLCSAECRRTRRRVKRSRRVSDEILAFEAAASKLLPDTHRHLVGLTECLSPLMLASSSLNQTSSLINVMDITYLNLSTDTTPINGVLGLPPSEETTAGFRVPRKPIHRKESVHAPSNPVRKRT